MRDFLERHQAGALSGVQALEAGRYEQAVFANQWNDVGNGAQRDEVQQRAQIVISETRKIEAASALEECVGEFEGEAR